jgi:lipoate synthase
MEWNKRKEILYQKTEFNNHLICQLPNIFKCSKCKRNNTIMVQQNILTQNCLFCGTPNYVKREKSIK